MRDSLGTWGLLTSELTFFDALEPRMRSKETRAGKGSLPTWFDLRFFTRMFLRSSAMMVKLAQTDGQPLTGSKGTQWKCLYSSSALRLLPLLLSQ